MSGVKREQVNTMAANPRFEINSSSTDGTPFAASYSSAHRSHFSSGSLTERNPSFRESREGRSLIQTSSGYAGGSGSSTHGEASILAQILSLDHSVMGEQKYVHQVELKRAINAALGRSAEDIAASTGNLPGKPLDQFGSEELKNTRASLQENVARARDRCRSITEVILKLERFRSSMQPRKRARPEPSPSPHERPIASLSMEKPGATGNSLKSSSLVSSPGQMNSSDAPLPKAEDKKSTVPNKRARTSLTEVRLDGRPNVPGLHRSAIATTERERDSFRPSSSSSSVGAPLEDKGRTTISPAGESWEKSKLKGRRSGTKTDATTAATTANTTTSTTNVGMESEREHKWGGVQHRLATDGRSRPSEGHGFRSGPVHGIVSTHKIEISSQHSGLPFRNTSKGETTGPTSVSEKMEKFAGMERSASKSGMKALHQEESHLLSSTITKSKAARAPRSSSSAPLNPSSQTARASPQSDNWDRDRDRDRDRHNSNKAELSSSQTHRKRPAPTGSSSSPVGQWIGHRPQKARVPRRMNLVSPVAPTLSKDETLNNAEDVPIRDSNTRSNSGISAGSAAVRRVVASSGAISQSKLKNERVTASTGLSESEESEGGDVKSKEKAKKHADSEGRFAPINQKMGPLSSPSKKSRSFSKDDGIDSGARRQGRSGRTALSGRVNSVLPPVDASANAKLRNTKTGLEKADPSNDLKLGRLLVKKNASDTKTIARPRRPVIGDLSGESDDDHEEIAAAVQAAIAASDAACSSSFWKQMEPYFSYLKQEDWEFLRQKVKEMEESVLTQTDGKMMDLKIKVLPESPDANNGYRTVNTANGSFEPEDSLSCGKIEDKHHLTMKDYQKCSNDGLVDNVIPLSQRLLAALIAESDFHEDDKGDRNHHRDALDCVRDGPIKGMGEVGQGDRGRKEPGSIKDLDSRGDQRRWNGWTSDALLASNGHSQESGAANPQSSLLPYHENNILNHTSFSESCKGKNRGSETTPYQNSGVATGLGSWEIDYRQMSFEQKIYLELESIALLPDPGPDLTPRDDDEIGSELEKFHNQLQSQVCSNKEMIQGLEKTVLQKKEAEERGREWLTMSKLIENAYVKRVGCRGTTGGASGSKGSGSKTSRAAALAFAKRTLARWKAFLETGQSSVTEPGLREMLFYSNSKESEAKPSVLKNCTEVGGTCNSWISSESKPADNAGSLVCRIPAVAKTEREAYAGNTSEGNDGAWSSRAKEKEVLLEEVAGGGNVGNGVFGGAKGKRSERERDGKGVSKEGSKPGRQNPGSAKGERRSKTKPRQKTLSKTVDGLMADGGLGAKEASPSAEKVSAKEPSPPIQVSAVPPEDIGNLPGMDDIVGQAQDLGSWLDFEDPALPDVAGDFVGLDVPMDDLADLAMMM